MSLYRLQEFSDCVTFISFLAFTPLVFVMMSDAVMLRSVQERVGSNVRTKDLLAPANLDRNVVFRLEAAQLVNPRIGHERGSPRTNKFSTSQNCVNSFSTFQNDVNKF
jgi:hypothetical protein